MGPIYDWLNEAGQVPTEVDPEGPKDTTCPVVSEVQRVR
jgi:hypothetical protein